MKKAPSPYQEPDFTRTTLKMSNNSINQGQHQFRKRQKQRKAAKQFPGGDSDMRDNLRRSTIERDLIKHKELYKLSVEVIDPTSIVGRDQSNIPVPIAKKRGVKAKISTLPIYSTGANLEIAVNRQDKLNFYGPTPAMGEAIQPPRKRKGQAQKKVGKEKDPAQENIEKSASSAIVRIEEEIKQEESISVLESMQNHAGLLRPQELFNATQEQGNPSGKPNSLTSQASKVHAEPHSIQHQQIESLNLLEPNVSDLQNYELVQKLKKEPQIEEIFTQNVKGKQPGVIQSQIISGRSKFIGGNTIAQDLSSIVGENHLEAGQQVISEQPRNLPEVSNGLSDYSLPSHLDVAEIPDIELASQRDHQ